MKCWFKVSGRKPDAQARVTRTLACASGFLLLVLAGCPAPTPPTTPTPKATEPAEKQTTAKSTESGIKPPNPDPGK